jgi:hypothetical protein
MRVRFLKHNSGPRTVVVPETHTSSGPTTHEAAAIHEFAGIRDNLAVFTSS